MATCHRTHGEAQCKVHLVVCSHGEGTSGWQLRLPIWKLHPKCSWESRIDVEIINSNVLENRLTPKKS